MKVWDHNTCNDENESLRQQLAAALAAIKMKDEVLSNLLHNSCTFLREAENFISDTDFDMNGALANSHAELSVVQFKTATQALAIQPDDSALKAWLGEPRSYLYKFNSEFGDGTFWSHRPTHNGQNALESIPLYAPKGLQK